MAAAVPLTKLERYVVNEETQLPAVFLAFCASTPRGGHAVYKALDAKAVGLLKDHNEAEDKVVHALQERLQYLRQGNNMVHDCQAIDALRTATYAKMNSAGAVMPQHAFKAQVERVLSTIAAEEASGRQKGDGGCDNGGAAALM